MVTCCKLPVKVSTFRSARAHGSVPGYPVTRGKCRKCGAWWCARGHRIESDGAAWLVASDGSRLAACRDAECGVFFEAWMGLWRKTAVNATRTPDVPQGLRVKVEALQDFLRQW